MMRFQWLFLVRGALSCALTLGSAVAFAQVPIVPLPVSYRVWQELGGGLQALPQFQAPSVAPQQTPPPVDAPGLWQSVTTNGLPTALLLSNPLLMTDGTVIAHNGNAGDWWRLTPDINGNYATGSWSQFATLPAGYTPLYFASEVLPDGRIVINGGEYNGSSIGVWTTKGAIYYPNFGAWTNVAPLAVWTTIGDSQSVVLNDGTYMLAGCCNIPGRAALFNATPPFTSANWTPTGSGHDPTESSYYDEEGWIVLPSGNVLTIDIWSCNGAYEVYSATTGTWSSPGMTPALMSTCSLSNPLSAFEMGPMVLRPDGTTLAFGGVNEGTDPTAIFNSTASTVTPGTAVPSIAGVPYTLADAPAATLPSGNVLFAAAPSNWPANNTYPSPTHFFEYSLSTNTISQTADTPLAPFEPSFFVNFLVLPTGQVLATEFQVTAQIYTETGASPDPAWTPVIDTSPTDVTRAHTYTLTGTQFNGLSNGAAYGDDVQGNTNYPIVQIVNMATGHVFYQRSFGFNTMSVAPNTSSSTNFTVSGATETGPSTLYVIANGISSTGVPVTVH
jgi:hypothetical protein